MKGAKTQTEVSKKTEKDSKKTAVIEDKKNVNSENREIVTTKGGIYIPKWMVGVGIGGLITAVTVFTVYQARKRKRANRYLPDEHLSEAKFTEKVKAWWEFAGGIYHAVKTSVGEYFSRNKNASPLVNSEKSNVEPYSEDEVVLADL